jgi:hypothetical protein
LTILAPGIFKKRNRFEEGIDDLKIDSFVNVSSSGPNSKVQLVDLDFMSFAGSVIPEVMY